MLVLSTKIDNAFEWKGTVALTFDLLAPFLPSTKE